MAILIGFHKPECASADKIGLSYGKFIDTVDAVVMGRNSFETALTFENWPYEHTPVVVPSRRKAGIPIICIG
jgi:hypothetical protein